MDEISAKNRLQLHELLFAVRPVGRQRRVATRYQSLMLPTRSTTRT